jgi:hypothetical protein
VRRPFEGYGHGELLRVLGFGMRLGQVGVWFAVSVFGLGFHSCCLAGWGNV